MSERRAKIHVPRAASVRRGDRAKPTSRLARAGSAIAERTSKFDPHDQLRLPHDKHRAIADGSLLRELARGVGGEAIQVCVSAELPRVPVNIGRREVELQPNAPQQEQQQRATAGVAATPSTSVVLVVTKPKSHTVPQYHRSEEHHDSQSSSSSSRSVLLKVAAVSIAVGVGLTLVGVPPPLAAVLSFTVGLFGFAILSSTGK